ncbi:MAG: hypothetical protein QXS98_05340 [Candidatus Nitrosocaldus sp.]
MKSSILILTITVISLSLIASVTYITAGNNNNNKVAEVNAVLQRHPIPFHIEIDMQDASFSDTMHIITVERGSSITVPVKLLGFNHISKPIPIRMEVVAGNRLDDKLQPISEPEYKLPQGLSVSSIDINIEKGVEHTVELTFTASKDAETGIFLLGIDGVIQQDIEGIVQQGQHIGTTVYLQIR